MLNIGENLMNKKIVVTAPTYAMLKESKPENCEDEEWAENVVRAGLYLLNKQ